MPLQGNLILIAFSAAAIGAVHSLFAPGHWLPVVLMTKSRRWKARKASLGAAVAASGHILMSVLVGIVGIAIGHEAFVAHEETIESYAGIGLIVFGIAYAAWTYFRHSSCHSHDHAHHGPEPESGRGPLLFLFTLGLAPCVAVLPVFAAAAPFGAAGVALTMLAFALGVLAAFIGATLLVSKGIAKLDHPILEHYGDAITGLGVAALGLILTLAGGVWH